MLNIYFNLSMLNPYLHRTEIVKLSQFTSEVFGVSIPVSESPEAKIDRLMADYVATLKEVKNIQDDHKAIQSMESARTTFMNRAKEIQPQIKQWLESMPLEDASAQKENLMLKPYFKQINDIATTYQLSDKLDNNQQMQESLESMDDFLTVLYQ
jgi:hypothetical protein